MEILYTIYKFNIHFTEPIFFSTDPNFIFRSVIGKNLHDICCIRKRLQCNDCSLSSACAYAILFETPLNFESVELRGRSSGAHPYVMNILKPDGKIFTLEDSDNGKIRDFIVKVTVCEMAIPSFSYFFTALYKAGKEGLFKEKKKYEIISVENKVETYYPSGDSIRISPYLEKWESDISGDYKTFDNYEVNIKFLTPFRYLEKGSISEPIDGFHIISSASRRMKILTELYGHNYIPFSFDKRFLIEPHIKVKNREIVWKEANRYSARQKSVMLLGGVVGNLSLEGRFSKAMIDMLEGVNIFNIGKNTSFGFGMTEVTVNKK
ncbi:MAG TPA: CRISPR system precrRNA processing endoribonuclease RAMP protein Cas6 [Exilispira sp.]|nr:CRISPR system precrRNA processing endoribonuclease RAMP protein Cas6 [Exilispira sp.]